MRTIGARKRPCRKSGMRASAAGGNGVAVCSGTISTRAFFATRSISGACASFDTVPMVSTVRLPARASRRTPASMQHRSTERTSTYLASTMPALSRHAEQVWRAHATVAVPPAFQVPPPIAKPQDLHPLPDGVDAYCAYSFSAEEAVMSASRAVHNDAEAPAGSVRTDFATRDGAEVAPPRSRTADASQAPPRPPKLPGPDRPPHASWQNTTLSDQK